MTIIGGGERAEDKEGVDDEEKDGADGQLFHTPHNTNECSLLFLLLCLQYMFEEDPPTTTTTRC